MRDEPLVMNFSSIDLHQLNLPFEKTFAVTADTADIIISFDLRLENNGVVHVCCTDSD